MLANIKIVLLETSHPGNIGATARAMKNMGLRHLVLVNPAEFPSGAATARAAGASDILASAAVVASLDEALADCTLVLAASGKEPTVEWPCIPANSLAKFIQQDKYNGQNVAIIFGREDNGLTRDELQRSHYRINIPANSKYSSLNLAQAVQIITYELFANSASQANSSNAVLDFATDRELELFYQHLEQVMQRVDFLPPTKPARSLLAKVRRIFYKASLTQPELHILRGVLTAIEYKLE